MKAVALTCPRCGGRLLVAPGTGIGVCNPCSTAYDFSTGDKKPLPVEEPAIDAAGGAGRTTRLPFVRFAAEGGGSSAHVYVMAFALQRIGTPNDDGSKLTVEGIECGMRPGRVDAPPELTVATAAALARFLALRRLDPDGRRDLRPTAVDLSDPTIVSIPYEQKGDRLFNPITGLAFEKTVVEPRLQRG